VGHDDRRPLQFLHHLRHRERLAGTGDAEQRLRREARLNALHQGCDGRGLVAGGLELRCDAKGLAGGHADTWAERSAAYYGAGDAVLQVRGKVVDSRRPGD
jgi:hypothetical protein